MEYRELSLADSYRVNEINGAQFIAKAWRQIDGKRQLVDINWQEHQLPNGIDWHIHHLETAVKNGGAAYGCFEENTLIGFAVINAELFGTTAHYLLLDQLFISLEHRGKGIGRKLFGLCCQGAKKRGADKLYICAGSAEETIAFYFGIGCEEAQEVNQKLYELDTRDYQLEYTL